MKRFFYAAVIVASIVALGMITEKDSAIDDLKAGQRILLDSIGRMDERIRSERWESTYYRGKIAELDTMITHVRRRGYRPDKLALRYIQIKSEQHHVIPPLFVVDMIGQESSWWIRTGMNGEVGYTQTMPITIKDELTKFGIPTSDFRPEDYTDFVTNLDWTYFLLIQQRIHTKRLSWKDWNMGYKQLRELK